MAIHCTAAERGGWIKNKESSDVSQLTSGGLMMLSMMMMMLAALYHGSDF